MFACMMIVSIIGILITNPIIGIIISNASASTVEDSFTPFSPPEESQQQQGEEDGGGGETTAPPPPPLTASMTIDSTNGDTAPATFLFEASAEGGIEPYTFSWDFGDGSPQSNEQNTEHTFVNPGTYVVSLTVTDSAGNFVLEEREVNVRPATTTPREPQPPTNTTTNNTLTSPQPTEPAPTQNQTQVGQNQTETTGAVESIRCPPFSPPASIVLKSGNPTLKTNTDSRNQFSTDGGINWSPAYRVPRQGAYDIITGTEYISYLPDAFGGAGNSTWYKANFTLPSQFTNPSLNIQIHADNVATIYLNSPTNNLASGPKIGEQTIAEIPSNFQDPPDSYSTTNLSPGLNILYFNITNFTDYTAFDYLATVTYCTPSTIGPPADPVPGPGGPTPPNPPPPTGVNVTCPANNVQHWDKIVFEITDSGVAGSLGFPIDSHLDIKVLDDPKTVADIEKKVLDFLKLPDNPQNRNAIFIIDVEYAIICAK